MHNNPQGATILINELISYRLASLLNITVPVHRIALVDNTTIGTVFDLTTVKMQFASKLLIAPTQGRFYEQLPKRYCRLVRNPDSISGGYILRYWLGDRDSAQYIFWKRSRERLFTVTSIDFGYCLGGADWNIDDKILDDSILHISPELSKMWYARLNNISDADILLAFQNIPQEWSAGVGKRINELAKIVLHRKKLLASRLIRDHAHNNPLRDNGLISPGHFPQHIIQQTFVNNSPVQ